uniref:Cna B-type domain-containing protein n=1 Tax=uncultured Methanobrevibacter sp. TaxID=253161 RepID=UPI0025EEFD68
VVIVYSVNETAVVNYTANITSDGKGNWTVNNTHIPELVNVSVEKVWNDFNDFDGIRPNNITVMLYANGNNIKNATLNKSTDWKFTFYDFDKYEQGVLINYTIKELIEGDYNTTINNNSYEFIIVNSHIRSNMTVYSPNMTVEKVSLNGTDFVVINDTVAFNITVVNTGDCDLHNVTVTDVYSGSELVYVDHADKTVWIKSGDVYW